MTTDQDVPPEFRKYGPFTQLTKDQRGPDPREIGAKFTPQFPSGYTPGFSRSQIEDTGEPAEDYGTLPIFLACTPLVLSLAFLIYLVIIYA